MTDNVVNIRPSVSMADALRNIADEIERGEIEPENLTIIAGIDIYQLGGNFRNDEDAVKETIWNCNFAISKLMNAAQGIYDE